MDLDLLPLSVAFKLYDGDGDLIELEFVDEDDHALNVSAYTWASQWRHDRADTDKIDLDVDVSNAATGLVRIAVTAAMKTTMALRSGSLDVQGTLPGGDPLTVIEGSVSLRRDATR